MRRAGVLILTLSVVLAVPLALSADADFDACATGAQEVPPPGVATAATADVEVSFDPGRTQAEVSVEIDGLGTVLGAHFHCHRSGQNGPVAFGLFNPGDCVLVGDEINCTLTNDDWTGVDCNPTIGRQVNNIAALHDAMAQGLVYFNAHTPAFPGGEIRAQMGTGESCDGDEDEDDDSSGTEGQTSASQGPASGGGLVNLQRR
jgi:hypothetical protein